MRPRCPVCRAPVDRESADFPFCGERCRAIDLGRWADEAYRIAGEPTSRTEDETDPRV